MAVRREAIDYLEGSPQFVAWAVRQVLAKHPPYTESSEVEKDALFKTIVSPHWWLLGTEMRVRLRPSSGGTQVVAETTSQWFIMGDVFDYYNRYIREFFQDLRTEIVKNKAQDKT